MNDLNIFARGSSIMNQNDVNLIVGYLRNTRNMIIEQLLNDVVHLRSYLTNRLNVYAVSDLKLEFVRRGMRALAERPIDLVHYSDVIIELKRKNTLTIESNQDNLFHLDIKKAIENYLL